MCKIQGWHLLVPFSPYAHRSIQIMNALPERAQSVSRFCYAACFPYEQCIIGCHKIRQTISHAFGSKCATTKAFLCLQNNNAKLYAKFIAFRFTVAFAFIWSNTVNLCARTSGRILCAAHIFHGITAKFIYRRRQNASKLYTSGAGVWESEWVCARDLDSWHCVLACLALQI